MMTPTNMMDGEQSLPDGARPPISFQQLRPNSNKLILQYLTSGKIRVLKSIFAHKISREGSTVLNLSLGRDETDTRDCWHRVPRPKTEEWDWDQERSRLRSIWLYMSRPILGLESRILTLLTIPSSCQDRFSAIGLESRRRQVSTCMPKKWQRIRKLKCKVIVIYYTFT